MDAHANAKEDVADATHLQRSVRKAHTLFLQEIPGETSK